MTQTRIKPIRMNITGTPTAGKVPAYVSPDEMEWVEQSGGGAGIIPGFNEPDKIISHNCNDSIIAGQYVCKGEYIEKNSFDDYNIDIYTIGSSGRTSTPPLFSVNFGQCFTRQKNDTITKIKSRIQIFGDGGGNSNTLNGNLVAKIYAIIGTYPNAVQTGSALATSNTLSINNFNTYPGAWTDLNQDFIFNDTLPAGEYCMVITGGFNGSNTYGGYIGVRFMGTDDGVYLPNAFENSNTPIVGKTASFKLYGNETGARVANALLEEDMIFLGQAIEDGGVGDMIQIKEKGEGDQTGATNDGARRYLSDTPGELSLTPGTNVCIIGQGSDTDKIWMGRTHYHEMNAINDTDVYYTNTGGMCGGWFNTSLGSMAHSYIDIYISTDNITRVAIQSEHRSEWGGDGISVGIQAYIPAGYYFKIVRYVDGTTITSEYYYFNPIK